MTRRKSPRHARLGSWYLTSVQLIYILKHFAGELTVRTSKTSMAFEIADCLFAFRSDERLV